MTRSHGSAPRRPRPGGPPAPQQRPWRDGRPPRARRRADRPPVAGGLRWRGARRGVAAAGVAGALLALALAGCEEGSERVAPAPQATVSAPPATEPPPVPAPAEPGAEPGPAETAAPPEPAVVPLAPEEYADELASRTARLGRALARVAEARSYEALSARVERAAAVAEAVSTRLAALVPPEEAAAAHERLVAGLRRLASGLDETASAVAERALCAAPSVLARLGRLPARRPLRLAARELRSAGYGVAPLVPRGAPARTRRLASGEFVFAEARSGFGTLTVDNGLDVDGVVVLTRGRTPVTSMYVRGRDVAAVGGIPDGTYRAYFTLGMDWDPELRQFTRRCDFARFDEAMVFESVTSGGSIQYQTYSITLHGVAGGTASTSDVSPDAFPRG